MSLRTYILSRVLMTIPMILLLLTIVFVVLRVLPGDPVLTLQGRNIPEEILQAERHRLGLDKPIFVQYVDYLAKLLQGDFGESHIGGESIAGQLLHRLPATIELAIASMIVAVVVGVLLGIQAAHRRDSLFDQGAKLYGMFIYSVPVFFLGLVLQVVFSKSLGWLPVAGRLDPLLRVDGVTGFVLVDTLLASNYEAFADALSRLILPTVTLGLYLSGIFLRISRVHMIETLREDFVTAARARGLKERTVLYRYGFRNALIPTVTILGLQFAALLAGAVLTETTFSWPGIGLYLFQSIGFRDYNAIQGGIVVYALLVALTSLIVDVAYAWIDPRIRY